MAPTVEESYLARQKAQVGLALALVDRDGIVQACVGDWQRYGCSGVTVGQRIDYAVPPLVGYFPLQDLHDGIRLPLIECSDRQYVEISLDDADAGVLVTLSDVTDSGRNGQAILHARNELALASGALERVSEELGQSLAALRRYHMIYEHEVRNASQNIQASLEMLGRTMPELLADPYMLAAVSSVGALAEALNAALEVEKALASNGRSSVVPADLARDLIREFKPLAQLKELDIGAVIDPGTDRAVALDPFRLRLILVNLLGNAIKFTGSGAITLRVGYTAGALAFEVKDTGPGLSAQVRQGLEAQFAGGEVNPADSSGLGLYICSHLARSMCGRLAITNAGSAGTTFGVLFPLRTERAGQVAEKQDGKP